MADLLSVKLSGDAFEGLDRLAEAVNEPAMRATGFAGAKVFQEEAIRRVPVKDGIIKRNIIIKRAEEKSSGAERQTYLVTVRTGKMNNEGDAFYWTWVENGHRYVGKKSKNKSWKAHRAAMAREYGTSKKGARPFMRPAYFAVDQKALDAMRAMLREKVAGFIGGKR